MAAGLEGIGATFLMTSETGLLLGQGVEYSVPFPMDLVTGGAGDLGGLMAAAEPAQPPVGLVATDAHLVLFDCRGGRIATENMRWFDLITVAFGAGMIFARTMTGFTLQLGKRCIGV